MNVRCRPRPGRSLLTALAAVLLAVPLLLVASEPASAAGSGILDLELTPVDLTTGATITEAADGTHGNHVTYRVQYSCGTAACDAAQVQFTPAPADPNGLLPAGEWILEYATWVPPAGGGTISGDDVTGMLIDLGDLAAGTSGTFSVTYSYQASRNREVPNGSFYPDGFPIAMAATITSPTAAAPRTANASNVTWHIGVSPGGPSTTLGPGNATFATDAPVDYQVAVNPGNMRSNPGSNVAGNAAFNATGNYTIVYTVPPEAVIQSADDGGVINNANHTVTWTKGTVANPSYGARGGWGLAALGGFNSGGAASNNSLVGDDDDAFWQPRTVTVVFPGTNFPEADADGCNFSRDVTGTVDVTVNYLDTARTEATTSRSIDSRVACTTPFGGLRVDKRIANGASGQFSLGDGNLGGNPDVYAVNVPAPGETDTANREWRVAVSNQGNVDATAVIDEPNLAQDHIKVHRILAYPYAGAPADWEVSVAWVDNTGVSGTAVLGAGAFVDAEPGRWFVSATTTAPLPAGRILPADGTQTTMQVGYRFHVDDGAVPLIGDQRTNTANVTLTYPADADGDGTPDAYLDTEGNPLPTRSLETDVSRTAQYTQPASSLVAGFVGTPVVDGGGNPLPGTEVTFSMRARTDNVWPGTAIRPQLVFVAPLGWDVLPGSAAFTAPGTGVTEAAPAGVTFAYDTGVIGTETRDVVVATWPGPVSLDPASNDYWPTLSVAATPTNAAPVGVNTVADVWAGDQSGNWSDATRNAYVSGPNQFRVNAFTADDGDVDGDGNTTEEYATADSGDGLIVAASDALTVVKELCIPDDTAPDGCQWIGDPTIVHHVPFDATDITYRVQLVNAGNTTLHDVVAYDVLPYPGDTGLLASPAPRGSELGEILTAIESSSPGLLLAGSASTNPARPEVNPGATGTVDDWGPVAAGQRALRLTVDGDLPAGETREVTFLAGVASGAEPGQVACNSVAVDSGATLPAEPPSVCVTLDAPPNVAPTADITTPADGAVYFQGQTVPATYTCADTDGTVVSCLGPVPVGAAVDTATVGTKTFTVTATDDDGATGSDTTTYTVVAVAGLCRATPFSLLGITLGTANARTSPCVTDSARVLGTRVTITPAIPLLRIPANAVQVGVLTGATQSGPGSASAHAEVATVKISLFGQTIVATGLTSSASSVLSSCSAGAALSGLSSIASLTVNGRPIANLDQSISIPLLIGSLNLNERVVSGNTITRTALHLNVLGLIDLALGQSVAGASC